MADLLFVALLLALFAATVGFVKVCDRMVGADESVVALEPVPAPAEPEKVPA